MVFKGSGLSRQVSLYIPCTTYLLQYLLIQLHPLQYLYLSGYWMVRAPGRVTYVPVKWVLNLSWVKAHEMPEFMAFRKVMRNVNCYKCSQFTSSTNKDILLLIPSLLCQARLVLESLTLCGATVYVFLSLKEIYHQGYRIFFQTLVSVLVILTKNKILTTTTKKKISNFIGWIVLSN